MRLIAILVLAFGAALAGGAIYYASEYFEQFQARDNQGPKLISVIAAKKDIAYGTRITADEHLRWVKIPEATAPEGIFTDADDLLGPKDERDTPSYTRYALRAFVPNEVILASRITGFGEEQRMAMRLGEGRRAFTIRIDAQTGVAGFVSPGDRVDILLTRTGGQSELESVVILENVLIIAVDQQTNSLATAPTLGRTATVEVTPTEAQKLALAQQVGRLSLTLRGYSDPLVSADTEDDRRPEAINLRDLLGEKEREVRPSITVRKGGVSEEVSID